MIDPETRKAIRAAFEAGQLRATAVNPETEEVSLEPVKDVMRHATGHKPLARVTLEDGRAVTCTEDHSLFVMGGGDGGGLIRPARAEELTPGVSRLATVDRGGVRGVKVTSVVMLPPAPYTYDLCVPGPENFALSNGILAHNSYSIGGVSLDIQRASSYQSLADSASQQFDKATEAKARTVKWIRGIQQPRFGIGVRSSFGPHVGRGVLSPRGFM